MNTQTNRKQEAAAHIGLIALDGCYTSSLAGIIDSLQIANAHIRNSHGEHAPQFSWEIISRTGAPVMATGHFPIAASHSLANANHCDLLYIPSLFYSGKRTFSQWLSEQQDICAWLEQRWRAGSRLAANCTGTFLLAETGLLNGRQATCTWWLEQQFRFRYPRITLKVNELIIQDERIISAGAMSSYLHLATHIIELFTTPEIAASCAKSMLIDMGQSAQAPYKSFSGMEDSLDPITAKATFWLQEHLHEHIEMTQLASEVNVSQRTLIRKFKAEFSVSPLTYLQNLRIETAKKLLEGSSLPLADIIEQVGYADASSFSRLFHKRQGITPAMYRHRFRPTDNRPKPQVES